MLTRRTLLKAAAASGALACVPTVPAATLAAVQPRLALLIGNGAYPSPHDLPPIAKNVMDLGDALAFRGFDVTQAMNLDPASLRRTVTEFVQRVAQAGPDSVTLFYFAGHGLQLDANNLLLGSGANPASPRKEILAQSLVLQQRLLAALPPRPGAFNLTLIDACRTDLRKAIGDSEGLNQVEAPLGSVVCFSTAAGRPAVAPARPDQNTFFTAALVRALMTLPGDTHFGDLLQVVKQDVEATMRQHPLAAIRQLAQSPFIADNTRIRVALDGNLGVLPEARDAPDGLVLAQEERDWLALRSAVWPADVIAQAQTFLERYPASAMLPQARVLKQGAETALAVLRNRDVKLYRSSFITPDNAQEDLKRAARGDKDAAARIARSHRALNTDLGLLRYEGWLQYAAGLGNGIASYELALYYRAGQQPILAAQAEARAVALGYVPPRSLQHERK